MLLTDVKSQFHSLIDQVENPDLLESFLRLFKSRINEPESKLWNGLSVEEQKEILEAFNESEKDENLVSNEEMKRKYDKWLKK